MNPLAVTSLSARFSLPSIFHLLSRSLPSLFSSARRSVYWVFASFPSEGQQRCLSAPPSGKVARMKSKRSSLDDRICSHRTPAVYTNACAWVCTVQCSGGTGWRAETVLNSAVLIQCTAPSREMPGGVNQTHVPFI